MRVFHPIHYIDVPASEPHPPKTSYRVSIGHEHWDDTIAYVTKVQMVYDGVVTGRKSPSYPEGTNDLRRVIRALGDVKKQKGTSGRGKSFPAGGEIHLSKRIR